MGTTKVETEGQQTEEEEEEANGPEKTGRVATSDCLFVVPYMYIQQSFSHKSFSLT